LEIHLTTPHRPLYPQTPEKTHSWLAVETFILALTPSPRTHEEERGSLSGGQQNFLLHPASLSYTLLGYFAEKRGSAIHSFSRTGQVYNSGVRKKTFAFFVYFLHTKHWSKFYTHTHTHTHKYVEIHKFSSMSNTTSLKPETLHSVQARDLCLAVLKNENHR
jgi:hypothetical protein